MDLDLNQDYFPPNSVQPAERSKDAVAELTSGPPPRSSKSVERAAAIGTETEGSASSRPQSSLTPRKPALKLVFTEFGLSPASSPPPPPPAKSADPHWSTPLGDFHLKKLVWPGSSSNQASKARKKCHCKQSKCLKLYCECFASAVYCDKCSCVDCHNNVDKEEIRIQAAEIVLDRNPNAFRPKIASSPCSSQANGDAGMEVLPMGKHYKGCNCRKTGCLKKYCECYQAGIFCSENCKCVDCKNLGGCQQQMDLFCEVYDNAQAELEKTNAEDGRAELEKPNAVVGAEVENADAAVAEVEAEKVNAAVAGAVIEKTNAASAPAGYISRKRKLQEFLIANKRDQMTAKFTEHHQVNRHNFSGSFPPLLFQAVHHAESSAAQRCFPHRSSLAEIIHPLDTRELCSLLVVLSEAAKFLAVKDGVVKMNTIEENHIASALAGDNMNDCRRESDVHMIQERLALTCLRNHLWKLIISSGRKGNILFHQLLNKSILFVLHEIYHEITEHFSQKGSPIQPL